MASRIHGQDLSWFFAEWYDSAIFAHYTVAVEVKEESGAFKSKVTVLQPDDLIKMPADITLIGAKGERQVLANQVLDKKENVVEATTPFKPVKVIVDEDGWVLKRPGSDNIWSSEKVSAGL
jgi:hypothetical protein